MVDQVDNTPEFDIQEIFAELLEDDSWEPDRDKRQAALMSLQFSVSY